MRIKIISFYKIMSELGAPIELDEVGGRLSSAASEPKERGHRASLPSFPDLFTASAAGGDLTISRQRHSSGSFTSQEGSSATPGSPPTPRSRRDRNAKLQSTRLIRSATTSLVGPQKLLRGHKQTGSEPSNKSGVEEALGTFEQPKEFKTKMGFAEQQKWITVQQKTFTKW